MTKRAQMGGLRACLARLRWLSAPYALVGRATTTEEGGFVVPFTKPFGDALSRDGVKKPG